LERVERLVQRVLGLPDGSGKTDPDLNYQLNYAVMHVGDDIPAFSFNTAIARIMELVNAAYKYTEGECDGVFARQAAEKLILLLAPFAPHFAEEMWSVLGGEYSVFDQAFPVADETALRRSTVNMALQINGKVKGNFDAAADASREEVEAYVLETFKDQLGGRAPKKVVVVPGRLVNIVL